MASGASHTDGAELVARMDHALLSMRTIIIRQLVSGLLVPSIDRHVDIAKVIACWAIAEVAGPPDSPATPAPTVKDVAAIMGLEHSTASRLLSEAESEGLISRGTDPTDRRRTTLALTEDGQHVVADSAADREWVIGEVLHDWSSEDLNQFLDLLERMVAAFAERLPALTQQAGRRIARS